MTLVPPKATSHPFLPLSLFLSLQPGKVLFLFEGLLEDFHWQWERKGEDVYKKKPGIGGVSSSLFSSSLSRPDVKIETLKIFLGFWRTVRSESGALFGSGWIRSRRSSESTPGCRGCCRSSSPRGSAWRSSTPTSPSPLRSSAFLSSCTPISFSRWGSLTIAQGFCLFLFPDFCPSWRCKLEIVCWPMEFVASGWFLDQELDDFVVFSPCFPHLLGGTLRLPVKHGSALL